MACELSIFFPFLNLQKGKYLVIKKYYFYFKLISFKVKGFLKVSTLEKSMNLINRYFENLICL